MNWSLTPTVAISAALLATAAGVVFATHGGARPAAASVPGCGHSAAVRAAGEATCASSHSRGRQTVERAGRHGPTGPAGPVGPAGPAGPVGPTGPAGAAGPKGSAGAGGPAGSAGVDGSVGARGPTGATGPAGPTGSAGPTGAKGDPGPTGAPGATGQKGEAGANGTQGNPGLTGPAGPQGAAGHQGLQGLQGIQGLQGPTGASGARGAGGAAGATGPTGPAGPTGATGPKGDPGTALSTLDQLSGIGCSTNGTIRIVYDASGTVTFTCVTQTGPPAQGSLRINEVETGTSTSAADEFVEVVNSGAGAAEIGGWKVVYRSAAGASDTTLATIPMGTTLAPGAFYLLGGAAYAGAAAADQSFSAGLASTGGATGIRDDSGALVDSVGWGTATNALVEGSAAPAPPATAVPGSSIVRLPDGHDTNANAADFTISSTPTPKAANH